MRPSYPTKTTRDGTLLRFSNEASSARARRRSVIIPYDRIQLFNQTNACTQVVDTLLLYLHPALQHVRFSQHKRSA